MRTASQDTMTILNFFPGSEFRNPSIKNYKKWLMDTKRNLEFVRNHITHSTESFNQFYPHYFNPNIVALEEIPFQTFVIDKVKGSEDIPVAHHPEMKTQVIRIISYLHDIIDAYIRNGFIGNQQMGNAVGRLNHLLDEVGKKNHWTPKQLALTPQDIVIINRQFHKQAQKPKRKSQQCEKSTIKKSKGTNISSTSIRKQKQL